MQHITTIEGVHVFSDKALKRIDGPIVRFKDGSTCDARTYTINMEGSGVIRLSNDPDAGAPPVERTVAYTANRIEVTNIPGVVIGVAAHDAPDVLVRVEGSPVLAKTLAFVIRDGVLSVRATRESANIHFAESFGGIRNFVTQPLGISELRLTITVPRGTGVRASGLLAPITIGDTGGDLHLETMGAADIGRIANATIRATGTDDIRIAHVTGDIDAELSGTGKLRIGDITVNRVRGAVRQSSTGLGNIRVKTRG